MTTNLSNEFSLELTLNDVIFEAYDLLQVATDGETITGGLFNRALSSLNIMLKLWQSQGIHLWTMTEGSLLLRVGQSKYDFRDEGYFLGPGFSTPEDITGSKTATHLTNAFSQESLKTEITGFTKTIELTDDGDLPAIVPGDNWP